MTASDEKNSNKVLALAKMVDAELDKIFENVTAALSDKSAEKITLERVDKTLEALFGAINGVKSGKSVRNIPDFRRIITGDD